MHILTIGGSGFLSGEIARRMMEAGHKVTAMTRGQKPLPPGVTGLACDRTDHHAMRAAIGQKSFDAVVDCVGYRGNDVRASAEALVGKTRHYLFISTDFVYKPNGHRLPIPETAPLDTIQPYGVGKIECERALLEIYQLHRLPVTIFRPPHIMGAGSHLGTGSYKNRDAMLLDALRKDVPVILLDDGALLIQPVVHTDIADGVLAAIGRPQSYGRIYNMSGRDVVTSREYYQMLGQIIARPVRFLSLSTSLYLRLMPQNAPFARHRLYDMSGLKNDLGFTPRVGVQEVMEQMVKWIDEHKQAKPYEADAREVTLRKALETCEADVLKLAASAG